MSESHPGLYASLKGLLGTSLALLQTRFQLLTTELEEEVQRLLALLIWSIVAVLAVAAGVVFFAIFMTVLLWDSHRLLALGIATAVFVGGGSVAAYMAWRLVKTQSRLFEASLAELSRDRAALRETE